VRADETTGLQIAQDRRWRVAGEPREKLGPTAPGNTLAHKWCEPVGKASRSDIPSAQLLGEALHGSVRPRSFLRS
jgi:hypothetical protein